MKLLTRIVLLSLVAFAVSNATTSDQTLSTTISSSTEFSSTSSIEPSTTTSTTESTTTTTTKPTSTKTTEPTSTKTTEPTTTKTTEPTSTSSSTTEPTTATSTTTTESSSTSTVKPTVPPPPKPSDIPKVSFNVTGGGGTCIRVVMKAYMEISIKESHEYIVVYQNASSEGSRCDFPFESQSLVLSAPSYYTLTMIFVNDSNTIYVNETTLNYTLPEETGMISSDEKLFSVAAGKSYVCNSQAQVKLGNITTLYLENVQIQAFGPPENTGFGAAQECAVDDKVNDAIPIAVGCALAALIIIVLIAYLVGRRQTRQRGYQSV